MKATYRPYTLTFQQPVLTSRGSMRTKHGFFLEVAQHGFTAMGEVSFIKGLSRESASEAEACLQAVVQALNAGTPIDPAALQAAPSVQMAYECVQLQLQHRSHIMFRTPFTTAGVPMAINGLVWMADQATMLRQMQQKLADGYRCIKLKVGALPFEQELDILKTLRQHFSEREVELRLDANGAFAESEVYHKLQALSQFHIHSIEQPVRHGQPALMAEVVRQSPIAVALDEELIYCAPADRAWLLDTIRPPYIILKPSLLGGFEACNRWIALAEARGIGWWATSALESNVGLSAIAQWVSAYQPRLTQGLGTGSLYTSNLPSSLRLQGPLLYFQ